MTKSYDNVFKFVIGCLSIFCIYTFYSLCVYVIDSDEHSRQSLQKERYGLWCKVSGNEYNLSFGEWYVSGAPSFVFVQAANQNHNIQLRTTKNRQRKLKMPEHYGKPLKVPGE